MDYTPSPQNMGCVPKPTASRPRGALAQSMCEYRDFSGQQPHIQEAFYRVKPSGILPSSLNVVEWEESGSTRTKLHQQLQLSVSHHYKSSLLPAHSLPP